MIIIIVTAVETSNLTYCKMVYSASADGGIITEIITADKHNSALLRKATTQSVTELEKFAGSK
jgi:hypothetical protein